jgi:hypothetical protein
MKNESIPVDVSSIKTWLIDNTSVINSRLKERGTQPSASDVLNNSAKQDATKSDPDFPTGVIIVSAADVLLD